AAGVIRTGAELKFALTTLRTGAVSPAAADAAEMGSIICASALARTRSIGAHQRSDEPAAIAV
ncbi:MAG: L-aspartate oxidase, partial [Candidatus Dormibacteraeota bacterium]|nr:L-aspartate oxidase [Candidatus Dormibacteraeota bacterium]